MNLLSPTYEDGDLPFVLAAIDRNGIEPLLTGIWGPAALTFKLPIGK